MSLRRLAAAAAAATLTLTLAPVFATGAAADDTAPPVKAPEPVTHGHPVAPQIANRDTDTASLYEQAGLSPQTPATSNKITANAGSTTDPLLPPGLNSHVDQSCTGTGIDGMRVEVMYMREADMPDRYAAVAPVLLNETKYIDDAFAVSAMTEGGGKRVRWVTDANCRVVIQNVVLPDGALSGDHDVTEAAMNNAGLFKANRKYLVFADVPMGGMGGMACGKGTMYLDSGHTDNANDGRYPQMARVDRECWVTDDRYNAFALHELMHTLGSVQPDAPHGSKYGHCSDSFEVMCYADGSVTPTEVCPESQKAFLDCNRDDYFNANPPGGSYLATHWNTANSPFLNTAPALPEPPPLSVTASATAPSTGDKVTFTANVPAGTTVKWDTDVPECETSAATTGLTFEIVCFNEYHPTVTAYASTGSAVTHRAVGTLVRYQQGAWPDLQVDHPASAFHSTPFTLTAKMVNTSADYSYKWTLNTAGCTSSNGTGNARLDVSCAASTQGSMASFRVEATRLADGAVETRTVGVQIMGAQDPTVSIEGPAEVLAGQTATFTAVVTNAVSPKYAWSSLAGFPETGAATATYKVTPPSSSSGAEDRVYVTVTNSDGRKATASFAYRVVAALKVTLSAPKTMAPGADPVTVTAVPSRKAVVTWADNQDACSVVAGASYTASLSCDGAFLGPVVVTVTATENGEVATASKTVTVTTETVEAESSQLRIHARSGFPTRFTITLTDKVTGDPLAGRTVDLERRGDVGGYTVAESVVTNRYGKATITVPVTVAGFYRAQFTGDGTHEPSVSMERRLTVYTDLSNTKSRKGLTARIVNGSGEGIEGLSLVLKKRVVGTRKWSKVRAYATGSGGVVTVKINPRKRTDFRWVFNGTSDYQKSQSPSVRLR